MKTTWSILGQVHALCLQSIHELGSIREVDRTLAQTLMAEFARLHLIVTEDLLALHADLETSGAALVSNISSIVDFLPDDSRLPQFRASLRKFQQTTSLKIDLPLAELEAAHEDLEAFMKSSKPRAKLRE